MSGGVPLGRTRLRNRSGRDGELGGGWGTGYRRQLSSSRAAGAQGRDRCLFLVVQGHPLRGDEHGVARAGVPGSRGGVTRPRMDVLGQVACGMPNR